MFLKKRSSLDPRMPKSFKFYEDLQKCPKTGKLTSFGQFPQANFSTTFLLCLGVLFTKSCPRLRAEVFASIVNPDLKSSIAKESQTLKFFFDKLVSLSTILITDVFKESYLDLAPNDSQRRLDLVVYTKSLNE